MVAREIESCFVTAVTDRAEGLNAFFALVCMKKVSQASVLRERAQGGLSHSTWHPKPHTKHCVKFWEPQYCKGAGKLE